jgi:hypothetical protein
MAARLPLDIFALAGAMAPVRVQPLPSRVTRDAWQATRSSSRPVCAFRACCTSCAWALASTTSTRYLPRWCVSAWLLGKSEDDDASALCAQFAPLTATKAWGRVAFFHVGASRARARSTPARSGACGDNSLAQRRT